MDDHGDDYGMWLGDGQPDPTAYRTDEDWTAIAGYLRHAANKIGPPLPLCLPGEPQECGRSSRQHVLAWGAALKAAAQHVIEEAAPSPAHAAYATGPLYQLRLSELRSQAATPSQ
jgi:hypothetical protein